MTAYIVAELDKVNERGCSPMKTIYVVDVEHAEKNYKLITPNVSTNLLIVESKNVDFMFHRNED